MRILLLIPMMFVVFLLIISGILFNVPFLNSFDKEVELSPVTPSDSKMNYVPPSISLSSNPSNRPNNITIQTPPVINIVEEKSPSPHSVPVTPLIQSKPESPTTPQSEKKDEQKGGNIITCFSWNIAWESSTSGINKSNINKYNCVTASDNKINECELNKQNVIQNIISIHKPDFICLQEATDHANLGISGQNYKCVSFDLKIYDKKTTIVATYYTPNYTHKYSYMMDVGSDKRPVLCSLFKSINGKYVMVYNVHFPHDNQLHGKYKSMSDKYDALIRDIVVNIFKIDNSNSEYVMLAESNDNEINFKNTQDMFEKSEIHSDDINKDINKIIKDNNIYVIMCGDFNHTFNTRNLSVSFDNEIKMEFTGFNNQYDTCCNFITSDSGFDFKKYINGKFDNIISSFGLVNYIDIYSDAKKYNYTKTSDHLPVLATITTNESFI